MITITESAAGRIQKLMQSSQNHDLMLRVAVNAGGCSGFSYAFSLDTKMNDDDHLFGDHGVTVVVDETSLPFLDGSAIDWVQDIMGASFKVTNPNAVANCGCGTSFSV